MDIIDDTGIPADVAFNTLPIGKGFIASGSKYMKVTSTVAWRFDDFVVVTGFPGTDMVSPRDLELHVKLPA